MTSSGRSREIPVRQAGDDRSPGRDLECSAQSEVVLQLGDMTGGLDVVERVLDPAVGVEDHSRTDDAGDRLPVVLLLPICPQRRLVGIRQQGKPHALLFGEAGQRFRLVRRDPDDCVARVAEVVVGSLEIDGLCRAAGVMVLG